VNLGRDTLKDLLSNSWNHSTIQPKSRVWNPFKRQNHFIRQKGAGVPLEVVSQPGGVPLKRLSGYYYVPQAGEGITIYIVDGGANLKHPVSTYF
jgi:hypothetical protein